MLADLSGTQLINEGFSIALEYWLRIKVKFLAKEVKDEEEIYFFKTVKPIFASWMEYYLLIGKSNLSIVSWEDQSSYWEQETKRYQEFCEVQSEFIRYYESNDTKYDKEFFLRRRKQLRLTTKDTIYEDADCCPSHDPLMRGLLANSLYYEYAMQRSLSK
jgi:hypothetical protein